MELNKEQQAAVETESKQVLVLAPPGSGKTRVIVERAAYLIEHCKTSPYELVLLTFTRRASIEMRERLEQRIGNHAYKVTIGTFHSVALNLLHRFGDIIGFRKHNSTVYSQWEEQFLLKEVARDLGFHTGKTWKKIKKKEVDAVFNKYYQQGVEPDELEPGYAIFKAFTQRCRENNSYTFGSLLTGLKMLLPDIHKYLNWKHLITDESQDTDPLQWSLIRQLQNLCKASLFCVSDTDQAIYGFRGADTNYLIRHQEEFDIYTLNINYRSDKNIVNAANRLISYNQDRIPKTMTAFEDAQSEIMQIKNMDSAGIVSLIKTLIGKAPDVSRAVLCRIHGPLGKLSRLLDEADIEHVYVGKQTKLTNSDEFRRFHAFLKLIVNPFDAFAFLLIYEIIGLSLQEYSDIRYRAKKAGVSDFQQWMKESEGPEAVFFINNTDKTPLLQTGGYHDIEGLWKMDVSESANFMLDWAEENPTRTIQQYLDYLTSYDLDTKNDVAEEKSNLQLLTMHAAKGLEFPTVIIAGTNEGMLPSTQAIKSGDIEGERRLAYVAITRAMDHLILTVRPEKTEYNGHIKLSPISRFIKEMQ